MIKMSTYALTALFFVVASISSSVQAQNPSPELAVRAFIDICIKSAPNFVSAQEASKAYGFKKFVGKDGLFFGVNQAENLVVQIKDEQSCSVDIPPVPAQNMSQLFTNELGKVLDQAPSSSSPFRAKVGTQVFMFDYVSHGSHRLIMVKG